MNTDPKAQIITTLNGNILGASALVLFFYDGPDPGTAFSMFDDIKPTLNLVSKMSFASFVSLINSRIQTSPRGAFNTLPTTTTTPVFLAAVLDQVKVSWASFCKML